LLISTDNEEKTALHEIANVYKTGEFEVILKSAKEYLTIEEANKFL
jgi:hypothetical protein